MTDRVKLVIERFGYIFQTNEDELLRYMIDTETQRLKNELNDDEIPSELEYFLVERVVAAFYSFKLATGGLGEGFSFEEAVKSIKMGDTSYDFADVASAKDIFQSYISALGKGEEYLCYRKLKW